MWGYLLDFAGSKETVGKFFSSAVKPKKNCSKNKKTSEEEINGGGKALSPTLVKGEKCRGG